MAGRGTRAESKKLGAWLDGEGRSERVARVAEARSRGIDVPEGWEALPGKKLARVLADRTARSQVVTTPTARDEAFECAHCGAGVPPGGRRPRDHCHRCLHSVHVDVVPGDRAAACGGDLVPVGIVHERKGWVIEYRCAACGASRRNRVLDDLAVPDDPEAVLRLVATR